MTLTGYLNRLSAAPGSRIECMISATAAEVAVDVVRLIHGDKNPAGPGSVIEHVPQIDAVRLAGGEQDTFLGSCVVVNDLALTALDGLRIDVLIQPTLPRAGREQTILALLTPESTVALAVTISAASTLIARASGGDRPICEIPVEWSRDAWYRVAVAWSADGVVELTCVTLGSRGRRVVRQERAEGRLTVSERIDSAVIGAATCPTIDRQRRPEFVFNGKIEHPSISRNNGEGGPGDLIADWRFELSPSSAHCEDASGNGHHGVVVNAPLRCATGHDWVGHEVDFKQSPARYAAIHFHEDDLDDAGWPISSEIDLPHDLPSGVYAVRLRAGDDSDYIPFVIRPAEGAPRSRTAVLLPTFTYIAYANERMLDRLDFEGDQMTDHPITPGFHDRELARHPEWGLSLYDLHSDGSTCAYSTHLRPIPNLRPDYRAWLQNAPRHLGADLYLMDWLRATGREVDVITDHDLAERGYDLLDGYDLVITGSHPEYVSERILDALEGHTDSGGSLMYLGGNGFYWVTSQDPERPNLIEVRRGSAGTRPSEGAPGEGTHSTTGEPGGLWRDRGRSPNRLTGVGMTSQGWDEKAPGYRRMPDSWLPQAQFALEGIGADEVIGDFGLIMNGASGDELDRFDIDRGSPSNTLVLARSTGHSDFYQLAGEDVLATRPGLGGTECADVRSDITLINWQAGGGTFSVGSICFTGSLSYNGYRNNVSRLVGNVIDEFLARSVEPTERDDQRP